MKADPEAQVSHYRRQAEHLRHAVELISDEGLREQLLGFARQYESVAASVEHELRLKAAGEGRSSDA
jgi:hypothetical protein